MTIAIKLMKFIQASKIFYFVAAFCLALSFFLLKPELAYAQFLGQKPEFIKVTDRVYTATGYALGNVHFILTDKSVVVVDTTESQRSAQQILDELRKVTQLPISYIIYTHHHPDHINGAKVFKDENTKIIAQKKFVEELAKYNTLIGYKRIVKVTQYGLYLPDEERGVTTAVNPNREGSQKPQEGGYIEPDILFNKEYSFEEGGLKFELYHTVGESLDHLMVWLPQEKVLLSGDLVYHSFPMLSNPWKPDRAIVEWAESVERMREFHPAYLVPSHTKPFIGEDEVDSVLTNYAKAIRYVHDETLKAINEGLSLEQMRERIHLPEELASLPYLAPEYGKVDWAINGIYTKYSGWYDLNPSHLNPGSTTEFYRAVLETSGGSPALVKRAQQALDDKQLKLVLQITDVVLGVEPNNAEAQTVRAKALEKLADQAVNGVDINVYRTAARQYSR